MTQAIIIGGHRGLGATDNDNARKQYRDQSTLPPENTLESLLGGLAAADFIEFDVVPAQDGLVVTHSAKLADHVFPKPELADYTAQLPVATLTKLTVGHRAAPQDKMPTLEALLDAAKPYLSGGRFLNLEIKGLQGTGEAFSEGAQKGFIISILQCVHNAGLMDRVIFSSFRATDLRMVQATLPAARTAQLLTATDEPGCLTCTAENMATVARVTPGITLHPPLSIFAADAPPQIPAGVSVNLWQDQTLPLAEVLQLFRQAVAALPDVAKLGFITDYPVELKAAFSAAVK